MSENDPIIANDPLDPLVAGDLDELLNTANGFGGSESFSWDDELEEDASPDAETRGLSDEAGGVSATLGASQVEGNPPSWRSGGSPVEAGLELAPGTTRDQPPRGEGALVEEPATTRSDAPVVASPEPLTARTMPLSVEKASEILEQLQRLTELIGQRFDAGATPETRVGATSEESEHGLAEQPIEEAADEELGEGAQTGHADDRNALTSTELENETAPRTVDGGSNQGVWVDEPNWSETDAVSDGLKRSAEVPMEPSREESDAEAVWSDDESWPEGNVDALTAAGQQAPDGASSSWTEHGWGSAEPLDDETLDGDSLLEEARTLLASRERALVSSENRLGQAVTRLSRLEQEIASTKTLRLQAERLVADARAALGNQPDTSEKRFVEKAERLVRQRQREYSSAVAQIDVARSERARCIEDVSRCRESMQRAQQMLDAISGSQHIPGTESVVVEDRWASVQEHEAAVESALEHEPVYAPEPELILEQVQEHEPAQEREPVVVEDRWASVQEHEAAYTPEPAQEHAPASDDADAVDSFDQAWPRSDARFEEFDPYSGSGSDSWLEEPESAFDSEQALGVVDAEVISEITPTGASDWASEESGEPAGYESGLSDWASEESGDDWASETPAATSDWASEESGEPAGYESGSSGWASETPTGTSGWVSEESGDDWASETPTGTSDWVREESDEPAGYESEEEAAALGDVADSWVAPERPAGERREERVREAFKTEEEYEWASGPDVSDEWEQQGGLPQPRDILRAIAYVDPEGTEQRTASEQMVSLIDEVRETVQDEKAKRAKGLRLDALPFEDITPGSPLIVTLYSPSGGVGKSSTAMNLGVYIAAVAAKWAQNQTKKGVPARVPRVLVLDGDIVQGSLALRLRGEVEPSIYTLFEYLDERGEQGFTGSDRWPSEYETPEPGEHSMRDFVMWPDFLSNLNLLAAPSEPDRFFDFSPDEYHELFELLARFYDVIVIDSGTEIIMESQRTWLSHAHAVFLLTAPEIDRLYNAGRAARYIVRSRPHPTDTSDNPRKLPPLASREKIAIVMTRADADCGFDTAQAVRDTFSWTRDEQHFFIQDFSREMLRANNTGDFLVLRDAGYAKTIGELARYSFDLYGTPQSADEVR